MSTALSKKRLSQIEAIDDAMIDTSDVAELDEAFFKTAKLVLPTRAGKRAVSIRLDDDVVDWFRAQGKGHLSRINAVLRAYMLANSRK